MNWTAFLYVMAGFPVVALFIGGCVALVLAVDKRYGFWAAYPVFLLIAFLMLATALGLAMGQTA